MAESSSKDPSVTGVPGPFLAHVYAATSREEKLTRIAGHVEGILSVLGVDLEDPSIRKTPERVARMYVDEIFAGLDPEKFPNVVLFPAPEGQGIVVTSVRIVSFCEHHLVPMEGVVTVGYIPRGSLIGLSKLSRIAQYFSARPQLQERLVGQIVSSLSILLGHSDVAALARARHCCVTARGARDALSEASTLCTRGAFESSAERREEFLRLALREPGE